MVCLGTEVQTRENRFNLTLFEKQGMKAMSRIGAFKFRCIIVLADYNDADYEAMIQRHRGWILVWRNAAAMTEGHCVMKNRRSGEEPKNAEASIVFSFRNEPTLEQAGRERQLWFVWENGPLIQSARFLRRMCLI